MTLQSSQTYVPSSTPMPDERLAPDCVSETKFYTEDGWVFREQPGKPIECIARLQETEVSPRHA